MAAGEPTRAGKNWKRWTTPIVAMAAAMLVGFALLGSLSSTTVGASGGPPAARHRLKPAQFFARRTVTTPNWWKGGACDSGNYPGSHPLGAQWHGLVACGPGPTQGGNDHSVAFFPGAWGEFEWECVELSMRWMYLAWGVNPYPANGWDVVSNYNLDDNKAKYNPNGPQLVVVDNGTVGAVPQPGDVISIARTASDAYGHTDVVTSNSVNDEGYGTITVIQQNGGAGNNGWATYPVNDWTVADGVSGWLHNPAWSFQRPVIGYSGPDGITARIAAPGNSSELLTTTTGPVAAAGDTGPVGGNGSAVYGYISPQHDFVVKQATSTGWTTVAQNVQSIAVALSGSGTPVLGYLSLGGDFYAEEGPLSNPFRLEATGVAAIAVAGGAAAVLPLLGFESVNGAFLVKSGVAGGHWTLAQASGVRSIALGEATASSAAVLGYLSDKGTFFARQASQSAWTKVASGVSAISLAEVGPGGGPLLGYLSGGVFYAGEGLLPVSFVKEASGVSQIAVASGSAPGALPDLGYLTSTGDVYVTQGPLSASFLLQAHGATYFTLSSLTDS